jgi:hypothetical protein
VAASARAESLLDETYLPREEKAEIIDFLNALRERGQQPADPRPRLVGPDGASVELPGPMFDVLLQVAAAMKAGLAVTVAPRHLTLSTQEAADLLHISRTTLVRLLEVARSRSRSLAVIARFGSMTCWTTASSSTAGPRTRLRR